MPRKKRKKNDFFATYDFSVLEPATPPCAHFSSCGGCSYQNITYAAQLKLKKDYLHSLFSEAIVLHPAPSPFAYRNRMDFIVHANKLSLRKKGDFATIIPIAQCHIIPVHFQEAFSKVQSLLDKYAFSSYDTESKQGFLRYITFRYAFATEQLMLICTTSKDVEPGFETFLEDLALLAQSVYWFVNETITDTSIPESAPKKILGEPFIEEKLLDTTLRFGPKSFFQTSTACANLAFEKIREFVFGNTVDLCCGVGSIGLAVEAKTTSLTGIELIPEAIAFAKDNAKKNDSQAKFFVADMKHVQTYTPLEVDTLILDPPRAGLGKKTLKRIAELQPKRIIYLSCNPKTQVIDLHLLAELDASYKKIYHEAFDFFPQTPHVESLLVLDRE